MTGALADETTGASAELHDVAADLGETHNLVSSEPQWAAALVQRLKAWIREAASQRPAAVRSLSREEIERLRSLGDLQ
jgi:hypothetical protein